MPLVATMADTSTGGGYFTGGPCAKIQIEGNPVAIVGSTFFCNSHNITTAVIQGSRNFIGCNQPVAYAGAQLQCGHTLLVTSQSHFTVEP